LCVISLSYDISVYQRPPAC